MRSLFRREAFDAMKAHDLVCPGSPLVARIAELELEQAHLEAQMKANKQVMEIVGTPAASISRAISPTD